jgi:predicted RNA-binding protein with PIN domain
MHCVEHLVVDGMNVIGSRPDGWWRDRDAAARRLLGRLQLLVARGEIEVTLVLDGASSRLLGEGMHDGVPVLFARDAGVATADDRIVALLRGGAHEDTQVVTSDRALQARVRELGATVSSPRALLARLDAIDGG